MQLTQPGPWLRAQFLNQHPARIPVGGKRLRLPAATVQGKHQQRVQVLPQRISGGQATQLGDNVGVPTQMQVRIQARLQRLQPLLRQDWDFPQGHRLRLHIRERLPPP